MPLYSFRCLREHTFDELHPIGEAPAKATCPECGHSAKRLITAPAIHFTGKGFSRTSAP